MPYPYAGQFDRLCADLDALQAQRRQSALAQQARQQPAVRRQTALAKSQPREVLFLHPHRPRSDWRPAPPDWRTLHSELDRLNKAQAVASEQSAARLCKALLDRLAQDARQGRLTGAQGAKLDFLRWRYGALVARQTRPTPPSAA